MKSTFINYCFLVVLFASCHDAPAPDAEEDPEDIVTPVTVTSINFQPMQEFIDLNATATYLQKWTVRANATGYLQAANVQLNQSVSAGQSLYTIKTKEAASIGNSINILDSTFHFTGVNRIKANGGGFISQLDHQNGDYVQDGEQLAIITDTRSFVFVLNLPYELRPYILNKKTLQMVLPDGEKLLATVSGNLPTMDAAAQTQSILLKVNASHQLPENLVAKVRLVKDSKGTANALPRSAVLSDETQTEFWVMKLIDSSTAAKVLVTTGIQTDSSIEIISPIFSANDKILLTGNYGLGDTAKVVVR
ncbi:MAG: HlyD family efflux transporter periplasmic adaptor subunit [Ferruginibacter sp.]